MRQLSAAFRRNLTIDSDVNALRAYANVRFNQWLEIPKAPLVRVHVCMIWEPGWFCRFRMAENRKGPTSLHSYATLRRRNGGV